MPDLASDPDTRLFPLADVPSHPAAPLGRGGKALPLKTVRNWVAAGRLRTAVINGRRYCCAVWLRDMVNTDVPAPPAERSLTERRREHARAAAACAAAGL